MSVHLTRRGRIAVGLAVGALAVSVGAGVAVLLGTPDPDASSVPTGPGTASRPATGAVADKSASTSPAPRSTPSAGPSAAPATGTSAWKVPVSRQALHGEIAGYAPPFVFPGQPIGLRVSTPARSFTVRAYRIGDYAGKGATRVGRWGPIRGTAAAPARPDRHTGAITAHWPVATALDTAGWQPGLYLIALTTRGTAPRTTTIPVVVASPDTADTVVLVAGDTTWQAYNTWGGASAYQGADGRFATRSRAVSFARPYNWSGYRWPAAFDIPLIRTAETLGVRLSYASVTSITAHPDSLGGALGVVSNGHDEYWPARYRDALVRARDKGTNLAFLGANAGYWKASMRDDGWTAWMPKSGKSLRWRDDPRALAENAVTGQLYDCFPAREDLVIRDPRFFLFHGTGVRKGTRLHNLVGAESDRAYPLDSTPRPIEIPAISPVSCKGSRTWSTITYYTTPSGAGVFATGTMDWVRAMGGPRGDQGLGGDALRFTRRVTANLVRAMAEGPMALKHPANDRLDDVGLPAQNTSGVR